MVRLGWKSLLGVGLLLTVACGGKTNSPTGGVGDQPGAGGNPGGGSGADGGSGSVLGGMDGGLGPGPTVNACEGTVNAPGTRVNLAWPNPQNGGHQAEPGNTVRFTWAGTQPHNLLQVALWEGNDPSIGAFTDAKWPNEIRSGPRLASQTFEWNTGTFPCGYRPGLYYFLDEGNPSAGIVALSLTDYDEAHYAPKPCSALANPSNYNGRFAAYASRAGCTQYEVNNFQTEPHYDWVQPTFAVRQGDLVLFRWSGLHNVVQVHDVNQDKLVPGGISSGPRINCVPGPNYSCINGDQSLGEHLIDTETYRPGMIHLSDGCAYGCNASCPWQCTGAASNPTGVNMQFLLRRRQRPTVGAAGSCCALDKTKGQACRVVDIYNDNDGLQFDNRVPVNRGDLVRIRWGGTVRITQTRVNGDVPSKTPKPGGMAMSSAVECIPGPNWTCLGSNTEQAKFIFDVDKAMTSGQSEISGGETFFSFFATGENTEGYSSADSAFIFYLDRETPYAPNPACP